MNTATSYAIAASLTVLAAINPAPALAQISKSGSTVVLHPAGTLGTWAHEVKGVDIGYAPNGRYLVVTAFGAVFGVWVDAASGQAIGSPFQIPSSTGGFAHYPRVTYSPHLDSGQGGFLITWSESGLTVQAAAISLSGNLLGPQLELWAGGARNQAAPATAYSSTSRRFLVAWQTADNAVRAHLIDVAPGSGAISKNGGVIDITNPQSSRDPGVAWDSANDQFGLSYTGWDGGGAMVGFVRLSSSGGLPMGRKVFGYSAAGTYMSDIEFNSGTNRFVMSWTNSSGTNRAEVSTNSDVLGAGLASITFGGTDSLGLAFNASSGTFVAVGQPTSFASFGVTEIIGVELNSDGSPLGTAQPLTAVAPMRDSFYPRVAGSTTSRQWGIGYNYNQSSMASQLLTTGSTGSGGGGAPPPPPPPCSYSITPTSVSISAGAADGTIFVTTGSGCAWDATSNSGFIGIQNGTGRSGSGSVPFTVAANSSGARTGTATIAGQTFTVNQASGVVCTYSINPSSVSLGNTAASGTITVSTQSGCPWSATPQSAFISFANGSGRSGPGTVDFSVVTNFATSFRNGTAVVAGQTFSVSQQPAGLNTTAKAASNSRADFDADGNNDLLLQDVMGGELATWHVAGTTIVAGRSLSHRILDNRWRVVGSADFNGDTKPDILWQHLTDGWLYVWYMDGISRISGEYLSINRLLDTRWRGVAVGDFNSDGNPDIIWQHPSGWLAAWLMNGSTVQQSVNLSPGAVADTAWKIAGAGDFNGDNQLDLVWRHTGHGEVGVWIMNGLTRSHYVSLNPGVVSNQEWQVSAVIDINGDNTPDLVWENAVTGWTAVWFMNGTIRSSNPSLSLPVPPNWDIMAAK